MADISVEQLNEILDPVFPKPKLGVMDYVSSGLQGLGRGATVGLSDYPAALVMMGQRALTGGPKMGYQQTLADIRATREQQPEQLRQAYRVGEIGGGLISSAGGVGSLAQLMGRTALLGGVSGFTSQPGMENVARDVATGAGLGALAGTLGYGVQRIGQTQVVPYVRNRAIEAQEENIVRAQQAMAETLAKLQRGSITEATANRLLGGRRGVITQANRKIDTLAGSEDQAVLDAAKSALKYGAIRDIRELGGMMATGAPAAVLGGTIGAGTGYMMGMDPVTLATMGATAAAGPQMVQKLQQAKFKSAAALGSRVPLATGEFLARGATMTLTPALTTELEKQSQRDVAEDIVNEFMKRGGQ